MTSEGEDPRPVDGCPGWVWWHGFGGLLYARRPGSHPPLVVRAHNRAALLERIRKAETKENR